MLHAVTDARVVLLTVVRLGGVSFQWCPLPLSFGVLASVYVVLPRGAVCGVAVAWRITVQLFEVRCLQLPRADWRRSGGLASQRFAAVLSR